MDESLLELINKTQSGYIAHWICREYGRDILAIARFHNYKGDKTYRQFVFNQSKWEDGLPPPPYPLYGLGSLINPNPLDAINICEGEKCASLAHQLKWPAVSSIMGADNVENCDFSPLRHFKQFIIWIDNDSAGIKYAYDVAVVLRRLRPDCAIHVCNLIPEIKGGDVVDWALKVPLYGSNWNGFSELPPTEINRLDSALRARIRECAIPIEQCPEINFKPESTLFFRDPQPIKEKLRAVPKFPMHIFDAEIGLFLSSLAKQKCVPVDFHATLLIGLIGGLIGRKISLKMSPYQRWIEVANLWLTLIGIPSIKKSPILKDLLLYFKGVLVRAERKYAEEMKAYKKGKKEETDDDEIKEPIRKRHFTDDCTTAKLKQLFSENPRGLILRNDELKGQLEKLEQSGNEGDRTFMMSCWSGLDNYDEDRMSRGSKLSIPLTLTWIGLIQPTSLARYLHDAISEGKNSDGFMQRFQMPCYPDFDEEFVINKIEIPFEIEKLIEDLFLKLDDELPDRVLEFSKEAQLEFDAWLTKNENDSRKGGHPTYWQSHLGKLPKLIGALCIILHSINEFTTKNRTEQIETETFLKAKELCSYYTEHAQRCYESVESLERATARKILDLVRQGKLDTKFKASDIYIPALGGLSNSEAVRKGLHLLQEIGWAVMVKQSPSFTGRPREDWVIHPSIRQ